MPCDQLRTIELQLGKGNDPDLLFAALTQLQLVPWRNKEEPHRVYFGGQEYIDTKTGQSQMSQYREPNAIRRAYSNQVLQQTAKKYGWNLTKTADNQYTLSKR